MKPNKLIISMVILLFLVITASLFSVKSLTSTSKEIENQINVLEGSIKESNWPKARNELENLQVKWQKTSKTWALLVDHIEIDNIEMALAQASEYINQRNKALALGETAGMKQYVKHIPDKESFGFKNIF